MLFEIVNGQLVVSEHALMISPFDEIWEADPTEKKEHARRLFKYVELVCSPRKSNPFFGYSENIRPLKVKKEVYKDETKEDTEYMIMAVAKYKELLTQYSPSYSMLISSLTAAYKLENYLKEFDFSERTRTGIQVIKPKEITAALKEIPGAKKELEALLEKVNFELTEESKTRKQRKIGIYER